MPKSKGESPETLGAIENALGYPFRDRELLVRALTHRSAAHELRASDHNEPLEFLGDSVLNFLVADRIVRRRPDLDEGAMTRVRASLVNTHRLAKEAARLGLGRVIRLGKGEERSGGREKLSILADTTEAVIGAIYLDGGIRPVRSLILRLFGPEIESAGTQPAGNWDPKTRLQELVQARSILLPEYRLVAESGPDHSREFVVEVQVEGVVVGRGRGSAKKRAEQAAASEALRTLKQT
ncbi:MAG: ribonuclease III [Acidobacteria bacterium]|nr:ribonuclease III [Acidobacteriota bacterium]